MQGREYRLDYGDLYLDIGAEVKARNFFFEFSAIAKLAKYSSRWSSNLEMKALVQ